MLLILAIYTKPAQILLIGENIKEVVNHMTILVKSDKTYLQI